MGKLFLKNNFDTLNEAESWNIFAVGEGNDKEYIWKAKKNERRKLKYKKKQTAKITLNEGKP